jgi:phosphatidylserine decarboxylase
LAHTAARMVYIIKAKNIKIGYIGLIFIGTFLIYSGMVECSGLQSHKKKGDIVTKGLEIGHFLFGGSTYVMLLQPNIKFDFSNSLYSP